MWLLPLLLVALLPPAVRPDETSPTDPTNPTNGEFSKTSTSATSTPEDIVLYETTAKSASTSDSSLGVKDIKDYFFFKGAETSALSTITTVQLTNTDTSSTRTSTVFKGRYNFDNSVPPTQGAPQTEPLIPEHGNDVPIDETQTTFRFDSSPDLRMQNPSERKMGLRLTRQVGIKPASLDVSDQSTFAQCDEGWVRWKESCYKWFQNDHKSFWNALQECINHGATLLYPDTTEELILFTRSVPRFNKAWLWTEPVAGILPEDCEVTDETTSIENAIYQIQTGKELPKCTAIYSPFSDNAGYLFRYACNAAFSYTCEKNTTIGWKSPLD